MTKEAREAISQRVVGLERIAQITTDPAAAKRMDLAAGDIRTLLEDSAELERLFELQRTRSAEATALWRAAHPGNDNVIPDLDELLTWLMSRPTGKPLPCGHAVLTIGCETCLGWARAMPLPDRRTAMALLWSLEPAPPGDEARIATMSQIKDIYAEGFECAKRLYRVDEHAAEMAAQKSLAHEQGLALAREVAEVRGLRHRLASAHRAIRAVATEHHERFHDRSVPFVDCTVKSCAAAREAMGDDA
jgi:hypothetical protein